MRYLSIFIFSVLETMFLSASIVVVVVVVWLVVSWLANLTAASKKVASCFDGVHLVVSHSVSFSLLRKNSILCFIMLGFAFCNIVLDFFTTLDDPVAFRLVDGCFFLDIGSRLNEVWILCLVVKFVTGVAKLWALDTVFKSLGVILWAFFLLLVEGEALG